MDNLKGSVQLYGSKYIILRWRTNIIINNKGYDNLF